MKREQIPALIHEATKMTSDHKILFVDDEPNVVQAYQRQLRKQFLVDTAEGALAALKAMETTGPYAVVVTDMRMPSMNGVEFLHHVRNRWPDSVRVMLTGNADQQTAIDAVNDGCVFRFLTKPCSMESLSARPWIAAARAVRGSSPQNESFCRRR